MKQSQKLDLKRSEIRQRLNELSAVETLTDAQRTELVEKTQTMTDTETQYRAAVLGEEADEQRAALEHPDAEQRDLAALRGRVAVREYLTAAAEQRAVGGSALEYNQALQVGANKFPLRLLAPAQEQRSTTGSDIAVYPATWLDRLFAATAAMRLGVSFKSVAPGVASYPVTTGGGSGAQRGKGEAVSASGWSIGTDEMKPKRHTVRLNFSREDALRNPGLEDALGRDMRAGIAESVDKAVFTGDAGATGTDADIVGLTTASNVTEKTLTQANKVKGDETLKVFVELVDGIHAEQLQDLRVVAAVGANTLWYSTVHAAAVENETVAQFLVRSMLTWTTRGNIETGTSNNDFGAFIGRGRGIEGAAVAPVWDEGELIRDPYTDAEKGEVNLTLAYYWDFGVVRPANYARLKFVA